MKESKGMGQQMSYLWEVSMQFQVEWKDKQMRELHQTSTKKRLTKVISSLIFTVEKDSEFTQQRKCDS